MNEVMSRIDVELEDAQRQRLALARKREIEDALPCIGGFLKK
jgi:hypothetical protein